jgi:hypothetical protein
MRMLNHAHISVYFSIHCSSQNCTTDKNLLSKISICLECLERSAKIHELPHRLVRLLW